MSDLIPCQRCGAPDTAYEGETFPVCSEPCFTEFRVAASIFNFMQGIWRLV